MDAAKLGVIFSINSLRKWNSFNGNGGGGGGSGGVTGAGGSSGGWGGAGGNSGGDGGIIGLFCGHLVGDGTVQSKGGNGQIGQDGGVVGKYGGGGGGGGSGSGGNGGLIYASFSADNLAQSPEIISINPGASASLQIIYNAPTLGDTITVYGNLFDFYKPRRSYNWTI